MITLSLRMRRSNVGSAVHRRQNNLIFFTMEFFCIYSLSTSYVFQFLIFLFISTDIISASKLPINELVSIAYFRVYNLIYLFVNLCHFILFFFFVQFIIFSLLFRNNSIFTNNFKLIANFLKFNSW